VKPKGRRTSASPAQTPITRAHRIARERLAVVRKYAALLPNHSSRAAARLLGRNQTTVARWHQAWLAGGVAALRPGTPRSGRRLAVDFSSELNRKVLVKVRALVIEHDDVRRAWLSFARTAACPKRIAAAINARRTVPVQLIEATGLVRHTFVVWSDSNHCLASKLPNSFEE
jgi:hypothetical protein